jgi:tetratricopeptide (TPR) repeat protein
MSASGNLPKTEDPKIPFGIQDSITLANFIFTELDSIIGDYIIDLLKNDWPFVEKKVSRLSANIFKPKNFIDSIAVEYVEKKISWADAHLKSAIVYLRRDDIDNHLKHMKTLIYQYPNLKDYSSALKYFYERNNINPEDFTAKRIGIIALNNKNYDDAITYLNRSIQTNPEDAQVLNSLAQAYVNKKDFKKAKDAIAKCLAVDPHFPGGRNLEQQTLDSIRVYSRD